MTSAWYVGAAQKVDRDPGPVYSTLDTVSEARQSVPELTSSPDYNQVSTDDDPALVGLSPRQLSGDVTPSQEFVPYWLGLAQEDFTAPIDSQVASAGYAPGQEAQGRWGRGTAEYTSSIEPVIRSGAAFGNDYFMRNPALIQEGSGSYMASPVPDTVMLGYAQNAYNTNSRQAYAGLYQALGMGQV